MFKRIDLSGKLINQRFRGASKMTVIDLQDKSKEKQVWIANERSSEKKDKEKYKRMCELMKNFRKHKWLADDCFFEFNDVVFIVNGEDNLLFDQSLSQRIEYKARKGQKFSEDEIVFVAFVILSVIKHLNDSGISVDTSIYPSSINFVNLKDFESEIKPECGIRLRFSYWDLIDTQNFKLNAPLPLPLFDEIWYTGVLLYEMASPSTMTGSNSLREDMSVAKLKNFQIAKKQGIGSSRLPEFPSGYSEDLVDLYEKCIEVVFENRQKASQLLELKIFDKYKKYEEDENSKADSSEESDGVKSRIINKPKEDSSSVCNIL